MSSQLHRTRKREYRRQRVAAPEAPPALRIQTPVAPITKPKRRLPGRCSVLVGAHASDTLVRSETHPGVLTNLLHIAERIAALKFCPASSTANRLRSSAGYCQFYLRTLGFVQCLVFHSLVLLWHCRIVHTYMRCTVHALCLAKFAGSSHTVHNTHEDCPVRFRTAHPSRPATAQASQPRLA